MCLETVYRGKQKREALAKLPDSGYYWKVVEHKSPNYRRENDNRYYPPCYDYKPYRKGWNKTKKHYSRRYNIKYALGFHLFRSKEIAMNWWGGNPHELVVRCKVKKKDIVSIGRQWDGLCIVTTRFWCPKPK